MLSDEKQKVLERFAELFAAENAKANISGCKDSKVFWRKHILDSAALNDHVKFNAGQRVVDVGTGGGLPGIVLAILYPDVTFVLIDSHRKKTTACENIIKELGLTNCTVICGRAEKLGRDETLRETFDWAVSRAVAKLPVLLEYALPLVQVGGWFVAYKGPDPEREVESCRWALKTLGGRYDATREFNLPDGDDERTLIFVEKVTKMSKSFPRRDGVPRRTELTKEDCEKAIKERMDEVDESQDSGEDKGSSKGPNRGPVKKTEGTRKNAGGATHGRGSGWKSGGSGKGGAQTKVTFHRGKFGGKRKDTGAAPSTPLKRYDRDGETRGPAGPAMSS